MSILSKNLKLLRKESYLSFEDIVEKIGCTEEEFIEWEEGLSEPDEDTLEIACQVLKMPYEDIRERDSTLEREEATKLMKTSGARKNYDWYFGSKSAKMFYIGYIIYFVFGLALALFVWSKLNPTDDAIMEILDYYGGITFEQVKMQILLGNLVTCLSVYFGGAGIFMAIWYLKRHTIRFSWWYILWFSVILTIFVIISAIACIPFLVYSFKQLFRKVKSV